MVTLKVLNRIHCRWFKLFPKMCCLLTYHTLRRQSRYGTDRRDMVPTAKTRPNWFPPIVSTTSRWCAILWFQIGENPSKAGTSIHSSQTPHNAHIHNRTQYSSLAIRLYWYTSNCYFKRAPTRYNSTPSMQRSINTSNMYLRLNCKVHLWPEMSMKCLAHKRLQKAKAHGRMTGPFTPFDHPLYHCIWSVTQCDLSFTSHTQRGRVRFIQRWSNP